MLTVTIGLSAFALLIGLLALWGVVVPDALVTFVQRVLSSWGYPAGIAVRLVLAALLWVAASQSHTPLIFEALAVLMLLSALVLWVAGRAWAVRLLQRVSQWPLLALRLWCCLGVMFSVFLLWSLSASWGAT